MKALVPLALGILGIVVVTTFLMIVIQILTLRIHLSVILTDIYDSNAMSLLAISAASYKRDSHSYYKYLSEGDIQVTQEFVEKLKILQKKFDMKKTYRTLYVFIPYDQKSANQDKLVRKINLVVE